MVYPVSCTAVCYVTVITLFIKKVGVVHPNFGGPPPQTPSGCALGCLVIVEIRKSVQWAYVLVSARTMSS